MYYSHFSAWAVFKDSALRRCGANKETLNKYVRWYMFEPVGIIQLRGRPCNVWSLRLRSSSFCVLAGKSQDWFTSLLVTFRYLSSPSRHFSSLLAIFVTSRHASHTPVHRSIKNEWCEPLRCPCGVQPLLVTSRHFSSLFVTSRRLLVTSRHSSLYASLLDTPRTLQYTD